MKEKAQIFTGLSNFGPPLDLLYHWTKTVLADQELFQLSCQLHPPQQCPKYFSRNLCEGFVANLVKPSWSERW